MAKIGFIGTGQIAAPMVRFLAARGHQITVTERSRHLSSALAASHGVAVSDAAGVLEASEVVVLSVRPHQVDEAMQGLQWRADHRVISAMAATPRARLEALCAPATSFVQTIPLAFLEQGGCPLPAYGDDALLAELFAPENPVIKVASEEALNAHFAICAMVPGLLDLMSTGAGWLGDQTGDAAGAEAYTSGLMAGFMGALSGTLAEARDALATEGTLSLHMTRTLHQGGAHGALTKAMNDIGERLRDA
ncbi:Pyrroline-5-carboxylate reductase [Candidatus Rhodobacter oscarellae]|uniref:Pyrroline-5-carboxylate reductase n=1 Tax=Candidatus Rhodobacter oscarellae TaxID=1675527 RepID=A0A0J9EC18_9RHOB|nr:NAD(P)-binding domain-containing protein [Candidatus Rhodobacter lobularis]KMW60166.1 Pyrroline-5-carboxylate reductase [Candidatus Rhodobacter lobularis]